MDTQYKLQEIQILLFSLPCTHNKEFMTIIKDYEMDSSVEHIVNLFDRIFSISKYSNTEVYHFLNVFSKLVDCIGPKLLLSLSSKVRSLKFFPSEKDTDLVIVKYFEVVNKMSVVMESDELQDVYSRYIFLQSKDIVNNVMVHFIYSKFKEFLSTHPLFLTYTIEKGVYKEMRLKNEFLMDFYTKFSKVVLIDSSFDMNLGLRIFIINNTKDKYLFQEFFNDIPQWYLKSLTPHLIPFLYYNFDIFGIYRELALEYCNLLSIDAFQKHLEDDLVKNSVKKDCTKDDSLCTIQTNSSEDLCEKNIKKEDSTNADEEHFNNVTNLRNNLKDSISLFNKTLDLDVLINRFGQIEAFMLLRCCKATSLKSLGEFLCKSKNEEYLRLFTSTFDFQDLSLIESLRVYLASFFLVGESQVIHRVLTIFSEKYFIDNVGKGVFMMDDEKTRKFLFNFSFSLLVLNTKMYNPNIKIKPSFHVHMADFSEDEIPPGFTMDYLKSQFESVCENKMELAVRNKAGRQHFLVYEALCKTYKIEEKYNSEFINYNFIKCWRVLFKKLISNFLDAPPDQFYAICKAVQEEKLIERYLRENKRDTSRFLSMFKYYTPLEGDLDLYKLLIGVLKRIEKPRHGVFLEIKNSLIKGSRLEVRDTILTQYRKAFYELVESSYWDVNLLGKACTPNNSNIHNTNSFILSLVCEVFENHLDSLEDLSMLPDDKISLILDRLVSNGNRSKFSTLSKFMSPESLLGYYKNMLETHPRFLNGEIVESFKKIGIYNEDAFCVVLNIQKEFDMFEYAVELKEEKIECRGVCVDVGKEEESKLSKESIIDEDYKESLISEDYKESLISEDCKESTVREDCKESLISNLSEDKIISEESKDIYLFKESDFKSIFGPTSSPKFISTVLFRIDSSKDILACYSFKEKFEEFMRIPTNLFHFYASSKSILNQSKAKTIHKAGCPLKEPIFVPLEMHPRLIYMLKKADTLNNKDVTNYTLWVINLISSSLPVFCGFFTSNFGLLLTIKNSNLVNPIIKIFCSRIGKSINMHMNSYPLCCKCGYNNLGIVEKFIKLLIKYDLVSKKDFDFYFKVRNEKIENGEIQIKEDGNLYLVNMK